MFRASTTFSTHRLRQRIQNPYAVVMKCGTAQTRRPRSIPQRYNFGRCFHGTSASQQNAIKHRIQRSTVNTWNTNLFALGTSRNLVTLTAPYQNFLTRHSACSSPMFRRPLQSSPVRWQSTSNGKNNGTHKAFETKREPRQSPAPKSNRAPPRKSRRDSASPRAPPRPRSSWNSA